MSTKPFAMMAVLVLSIVLGGCASLGACKSGEQALVHDTLYFGTGKPGGGTVTADEWTRFVETIITPRFPQGLTVSQVSGQWQGADGTIVRETTHVLTLVHPDDAVSEGRVVEVARTYKTLFQQEAVMRVSDRVCVSL